MNKEVQFTYYIANPGVAKGKIIVHDKEVPFMVTNISNPLYDLLKGMVSLIYEPSHLWDEENICWIDWYNQESGYKWVLETTDGKILNIKLSLLQDVFDDSSAKTIINTHCDFNNFYLAIISALDSFIKEIGLLNYEQQWQKDEFPLTYFLILKKNLIEHGSWKKTNHKDNNLSDEIDLLKS